MKLGSLETLIDQGGDCEDIKKKTWQKIRTEWEIRNF